MPVVRAAIEVAGGVDVACAVTAALVVMLMQATENHRRTNRRRGSRLIGVFSLMLREGLVSSGRILSAALVATLAALAACASNKPHTFGQYNDLQPRVAPTKGERLPQHVTVQLARGANVAIFLVVPGGTTRLLFPADSTQSSYIEAGSHLVETSAARGSLGDTSRLVRRPQGNVRNQPQTRGRTGIGRDSLPAFGFNQHGYLFIYASQQPLPYSTLATRVAGLSVPISDDDALNTVWKLIRERTNTTGTWAAYATDYPP
jgi:hypothetical protein